MESLYSNAPPPPPPLPKVQSAKAVKCAVFIFSMWFAKYKENLMIVLPVGTVCLMLLLKVQTLTLLGQLEGKGIKTHAK